MSEPDPSSVGPTAAKPQPANSFGRLSALKSNLSLRLLTALLLIPPVCFAIYAGGLFVLGLVTLIVLLGVREFYHLIEAKGAEPLRGVGYLAAGVLPLVFYLGSDYQATVLMSFALLGMLIAQLQKAQIGESLASISGTFFGVFYVSWLLSHAVSLRFFQALVAARFGAGAAEGMHPDVGGYYLFLVVSVTVAGDAGAYFVGRRFGRHKLAPRVSPNKTVEGALGAIGVGLLVALGCKLTFDLAAPALSAHLGWLPTLLFALLAAVAGILGDLIESLLKRDARVKDTGTLLPGTGGVLDRIDSNLLAIPFVYYGLLAFTYLTQPLAVAFPEAPLPVR